MLTIDNLQDDSEFFDQNIVNLDCRNLPFEGKEFQGCSFSACQFTGARFAKCKFIDCLFKDCDLSNVHLNSSTLRDVAFEDSKLLGVNWTHAALTAHLTFSKCLLSLGNFSNMDLRQAVITHCKAHEVEFAHADLTGADCRGTDFADSVFLQTDLTKADFRGALNYTIRPSDNKLAKAKFSLPEAAALLYGLDIILED